MKAIDLIGEAPFKESGRGFTVLVNEDYLMLNEIALHAGQEVPLHQANANVHLVVLLGELDLELDGVGSELKAGELLPVAYGTDMHIMNNAGTDAVFLVIKTPNPSMMKA